MDRSPTIGDNASFLERWKESADPWADELVGRWDWKTQSRFVTRQVWQENVHVDAARIVATDHAAYAEQMTWRKFLSGAQRISQFKDQILSFDQSRDPWTLVEVEGRYLIREGNHRSIISKFFALEEGQPSVRVHRVITFHEDPQAKQLYAQIEGLLRKGQVMEAEPVPVSVDGPERTFRIVFHLDGFRHPRLTLEPAEALAYVQWHNTSRWRWVVGRLRSALGT